MLPVRIIWQITITLRQKIALSFSLCLTVVLVVVTAVRVAGLEVQQTIDPVWSQYWVLVSAMAGLMVNSATALRWLFVARSTHAVRGGGRRRHRPRHHQQQQLQPPPPPTHDLESCQSGAGGGGGGGGGAHSGAADGWASKILASLRSLPLHGGKRTAPSRSVPSTRINLGSRSGGTNSRTTGGGHNGRRNHFRHWWLLSDNMVPRGTMTGVRTFIWAAEGSVGGVGSACAASSAATVDLCADSAPAMEELEHPGPVGPEFERAK